MLSQEALYFWRANYKYDGTDIIINEGTDDESRHTFKLLLYVVLPFKYLYNNDNNHMNKYSLTFN